MPFMPHTCQMPKQNKNIIKNYRREASNGYNVVCTVWMSDIVNASGLQCGVNFWNSVTKNNEQKKHNCLE